MITLLIIGWFSERKHFWKLEAFIFLTIKLKCRNYGNTIFRNFARANLCKLNWAILIQSINSVHLLFWTKRYQHHSCISPDYKIGDLSPLRALFARHPSFKSRVLDTHTTGAGVVAFVVCVFDDAGAFVAPGGFVEALLAVPFVVGVPVAGV